MKKSSILITLFLLLCLSACGAVEEETPAPLPPEPEAPYSLRISEVMANNKCTLADENGDFPDWLELLNEGEEPLDLEGVVLVCGKDKAMLPSLVLAPGEYRVLFCSDAYTGFNISSTGESLTLLSPGGREIHRVEVPALPEDESLVLQEDDSVRITAWPSPGFENSAEGYEAFQSVLSAPTEGPVISEVMVRNDLFLPNTDWVELYNPTDRVLHLEDYWLSDKKSQRLLSRLPEEDLKPGEYRCLLCDSEIGDVPIGLNAQREQLYLSDGNGRLIDYLALHDVPDGVSMGRQGGENGAWYISKPTPGEANHSGLRRVAEEPVLLGRDGVFDGVSSVTVTLSARGTIHYTLDGSAPDENSPVYTKPLTLRGTTVVRAVNLEEGCLDSRVKSLSYIINERHTVPVVSLICDPEDLFGNSLGIYKNVELDREVPGAVTIHDGDTRVEIDCGVKLHGATSRITQDKKSFKLCFRPRYEGPLQADLFDNGVTEFSYLLLRADQESSESTYMRDNLMHELAIRCFPALSSQDHRYAVLYINGEYWGIYSLREAHSPSHYANHYGLEEEQVIHWKEEWDSKSLMEDVYMAVIMNDLSEDQNYAYVAEHVDVDSVIGWSIIEAYSGNFDANSPNMRFYWTKEDEKLHYALVDLDLSMYTMDGFSAALLIGYDYSDMARRLLDNEQYRSRLIEQMSAAFAGPMSEESVLALIDEYEAILAPEIPRDRLRWGGSTESWEHMVQELRNYVNYSGGRTSVTIYTLNQFLH